MVFIMFILTNTLEMLESVEHFWFTDRLIINGVLTKILKAKWNNLCGRSWFHGLFIS